MLTDAFDALRALPTAAAAALLCYVPLALLLAAEGRRPAALFGRGHLSAAAQVCPGIGGI